MVQVSVRRTSAASVVLAVILGGTVSAAAPTPVIGNLAVSPSALPTETGSIAWTRVDQGADFDAAPGVYGIGQLPDGRLIVVGSVGAPEERAAAWVSKDGTTWRRLKRSWPKDLPVLYAVESLDQLALLAGRDAEGQGVVLGSTDGVDWTPTTVLGGPMYDLARIPDGLIGAGVDGPAAAVWTSSDGTSWSEVTLASAGRAVHVVAGADGTTVASGAITDPDGVATPVVWTTRDHETWSQTALDGLTPGHWSNPSAASTPAGFVVTFADLGQPSRTGHVFSSPDGLTWTETLVDAEGPLTAAGSVGSDALLIGHGQVIRSRDAATWTALSEPTFDGWSVRDVIPLADGRLFAAGDVFGSAMATWTGSVSSTP